MTMDVWTTEREKTFILEGLRPTRTMPMIEVLKKYRETLETRKEFGIMDKYELLQLVNEEIRRLS